MGVGGRLEAWRVTLAWRGCSLMGWPVAVDAHFMDVGVQSPRARRKNPVFWMVKVAALMAALSLFMDYAESRDHDRRGSKPKTAPVRGAASLPGNQEVQAAQSQEPPAKMP